MNKRHSILSVAAVLAVSALALQAPFAGAQSTGSQQGIPGVEVNVGDNASDRGLPGVEMNIGRQGDQNNVDTRALGAGADTGTAAGGSSTMDSGAAATGSSTMDSGAAATGSSTMDAGTDTEMNAADTERPMRADRG